MVRVLYFARIAERLGTRREEIELPGGAGTVTDIVDRLRTRGGAWSEVFTERGWLVAVNQNLARTDAAVRDNDEIAFLPPVTGG